MTRVANDSEVHCSCSECHIVFATLLFFTVIIIYQYKLVTIIISVFFKHVSVLLKKWFKLSGVPCGQFCNLRKFMCRY